MSARFKLTIIIPVYNEAPRIERSLCSVAQALRGHGKEVRVIVVDDGSTDGSEIICDDFNNIYEIYHLNNMGVSMARNHGLRRADSEYITFMDADDEMLPNGIETMLKVIEKNPDEKLIQMNHLRHYTMTGRTVRKYANSAGMYEFSELPLKWEMVWNKIYRADLLESVRFWPKMQYGEDKLFNLHCLRLNRHICCAYESAIIKHFDKPESLSKTVTRDKFLLLADLLGHIMNGIEDDEFECLLAKRLGALWNSETARKLWN